MDQSTNSKRFQPYARPAPRRQQPEPIFNEDTFQVKDGAVVCLGCTSFSPLPSYDM
jgi:hypothetical protein